MKTIKTTLIVGSMFTFSLALQAQVGVNNTSPKSSLHVTPAKTDGSTAEGIIAPNLTRSQLISKDAKYGSDQKGAMVYVTTIDGTVTTKTGNILKVGYYYFDGSVWQTFTSAAANIPTEPWQVQGGTTQATSNAEDIYQTGSVGIGASTAVPAAYKFQVTGASNVTGNSQVASSTVTGNETVGGTLGVTGAATLSNALTVAGTTTLNGATNAKATTITGQLRYTPGTPAANKVLISSDANGNVTWGTAQNLITIPTEPWMVQGGTTQATGNAQNIYQTGSVGIGSSTAVPAAYNLQVTGASNVTGNSQVGSSTVTGNETVGGTLGVTGAATLSNALTVAGTTTLNGATNAKATTITGQLRYTPGTPAANKVLISSDANGNVTWGTAQNLITIPTEPWMVQGGTTQATGNTQNIYQIGSVGIGTSTAVPAAYKFQVTGASNITGNSQVGSSTVLGNEQVNGNLGVTGSVGIGTTTLSQKLNVAGNAYVSGSLGLGVTSPAQKLHVAGNEYVTGISKIGGGTTYNSSAQLELSDTDKGFLPNRVSLVTPTSPYPAMNAVQGMIVFNTASVPSQGLVPGFYYWTGTNWQGLVDKLPTVTVNLRDLRANITSTGYDANNTNKGVVMNFNTSSGLPITIPEDGSYAFSFRLYGMATNKQTVAGLASFYYIALMLGTKIVDTAEMDITHATNSSVMTYSVTLAGTFQKGDVVSFRLSHNPQSPSAWMLQSRAGTTGADRTSMIWWKL